MYRAMFLPCLEGDCWDPGTSTFPSTQSTTHFPHPLFVDVIQITLSGFIRGVQGGDPPAKIFIAIGKKGYIG